MTKTVLTALTALALAACGTTPRPEPTPQPNPGPPPVGAPAPTPVGTPTGEARTAQIGPEGGSLASADGRLTLEVPAGAVASSTAFSVRPITNEAHGGVGTAYRLEPHGLGFAKPVKLGFRYTDEDVQGSAPELLGVAYQDAKGRWRAPEVRLEAAAKTVSVSTTHFSDWSLVEGAQLLPASAKVKVGQTVKLEIKLCEREESDDEILVEIVAKCSTSEFINRTAKNWSVNSSGGGNATVGTVSPGTAGVATYTAPSKKPGQNPVAVSVEYTDLITGHKSILVSNITVEDAAGGWGGTITYTEHGMHVWTEEAPKVGSTTSTYSMNATLKVVGVKEQVGPSVTLLLEKTLSAEYTKEGTGHSEYWASCEVNGPQILREVWDYSVTEVLEGEAKETFEARLYLGSDGKYNLYVDTIGAQVKGREVVKDVRKNNCFGWVVDNSYTKDHETRVGANYSLKIVGSYDPKGFSSLKGGYQTEGDEFLIDTIAKIEWNLTRTP